MSKHGCYVICQEAKGLTTSDLHSQLDPLASRLITNVALMLFSDQTIYVE